MTHPLFRDGRFDVVVAAGPSVAVWPSAGVIAFSSLCAEVGLTVGVYGGDSLVVRGVVPLPGTGGLAIIEDAQSRVHRITARSIVKVAVAHELPDPFAGWYSEGLMPVHTAEGLWREGVGYWNPATAILGTGNRALRFGSALLEGGAPVVYCVETRAQWGAKRYAGWEVERRRFEMLGGRIVEARPISLTHKAALLWELRLQDEKGVRLLEVARVVSAGPFSDSPGVREYPPGSFLYEFEQSAPANKSENPEGWALEVERGTWLAGRVARALVSDLGESREAIDHAYRRARGRLKRYLRHREEPFAPAYQGKWVAQADARQMRAFAGLPKKAQLSRPVASLECFEEIPCTICVEACPEGAIRRDRAAVTEGRATSSLTLNESACTACGLCLQACPSGVPVLVREREEQSVSELTLPWRGRQPWAAGEFASLINRRGEALGSARVASDHPAEATEGAPEVQLVRFQVPTHLLWEARSVRRTREKQAALASEPAGARVELLLGGEKRLVPQVPDVSLALYAMGKSRAEDMLHCSDASCGRCQVEIDGVKKPACRAPLRKGMSLRLPAAAQGVEANALCPCLGITTDEVLERMSKGKLRSPEALIAVTGVGGGRCHGQLCLGAFRRLLQSQGLDAAQWTDWRFPWADWVLHHN